MDQDKNVRKEVKKTLKKPISLRRRLLFLVVISWIVPVMILFVFMITSYRNSIIDKTEILMEEELKNFTSFHAQKINEAITISKKTSYELTVEKAWKKYKSGNISDAAFYKEIISNLKSKYYNDNRFVMSVFYLCEDPDRLYYTSRKQNSYIKTYNEEVKEEAYKITKKDTSDAHVKILNGKIYIIRNLYTTTNYTKFGTLVVELNKDKLFEEISQNRDYDLGFFINDSESMITYDSNLNEENRAPIVNKLKQQYSNKSNVTMDRENDKSFTGLLYQQTFDEYHFGAVLVANKNTIYSELRTLGYHVFNNINHNTSINLYAIF